MPISTAKYVLSTQSAFRIINQVSDASRRFSRFLGKQTEPNSFLTKPNSDRDPRRRASGSNHEISYICPHPSSGLFYSAIWHTCHEIRFASPEAFPVTSARNSATIFVALTKIVIYTNSNYLSFSLSQVRSDLALTTLLLSPDLTAHFTLDCSAFCAANLSRLFRLLQSV